MILFEIIGIGFVVAASLWVALELLTIWLVQPPKGYDDDF